MKKKFKKYLSEVLTKRQTSDCDVKCSITFSFRWKFHVYGPQLGWKTSTMILFQLCKIIRRVFIYLGFIFILYNNRSLDRAAKHNWRFTPIFAGRLCSSPEFLLYAYALSLELASLGDSLCARYYVHEISIIFFQSDRGHFGKHIVQLEYACFNSISLKIEQQCRIIEQ